jgi:HAD superfamily hydrolase (TIGR01549 family)
MNHPRFKALLIDIDDTVLRVKPGASLSEGRHSADWTSSLLDVLQLAGVELGRLTAAETAVRIARTKAEIQWWQITDFIVALGLDEEEFWDFAYLTEIRYLEPTGVEIESALIRLHETGMRLYITSNNSTSGIRHKLRLAGISDATLFQDLFGASKLHSMKWEPVFWQKVLERIGLGGNEVAVVGDNPRDDYEGPRMVGISHSFLIDRDRDRSAENSSAVTYVKDFSQIADHLLGGTSAPRVADERTGGNQSL